MTASSSFFPLQWGQKGPQDLVFRKKGRRGQSCQLWLGWNNGYQFSQRTPLCWWHTSDDFYETIEHLWERRGSCSLPGIYKVLCLLSFILEARASTSVGSLIQGPHEGCGRLNMRSLAGLFGVCWAMYVPWSNSLILQRASLALKVSFGVVCVILLPFGRSKWGCKIFVKLGSQSQNQLRFPR